MKITDEMLSEHAAEARDLWLAACLSKEIPEHRFSRRFNRQMRRLLREQKHSAKFNRSMRILQRTIAVLLVVITVSFGCMMSVEAYRVKFIDMVVRVFNDLTDYRFHSSKSSENAETVFVPPLLSYLPDAMDKVEEHSSVNGYTVTYAESQRVVLFCPDKYYLGIFDRNLREILLDAGLGAAEEFGFSRVDFSANARVDDPLAYIALARKSGVPNGYQETYPRFDNKKRNKPIKYAYSFDLTHNREDYAVTLYSKADQLKDDRNATSRDIQDAQGMLRFEAKYGASMLKTCFEMCDLYYSQEKLYDLLSASPSVLRRALCSCFPEGDYYSLPAARKLLGQTEKSKQRERLLEWIEETSRTNSACKAQRKICESLSFSQRAALMQYQRESGINPVTIGRDWKR